jgi:hypothetical protein
MPQPHFFFKIELYFGSLYSVSFILEHIKKNSSLEHKTDYSYVKFQSL